MSGTSFDKKTALRMEARAASAEVLSQTLKEQLRGSILVKDGERLVLFVPEARRDKCMVALSAQFGGGTHSKMEYLWNSETETVENWYRVELPEFANAPLADAVKRKHIPFATWRELAGETAIDAVTQIIEARAIQAQK